MKAKALICSKDQEFTLEPVVLGNQQPDQVTIRTLWSGVSIGTEFAFISGKIALGAYPICTGYMATGVIEGAGSSTSGFKNGDLVYFGSNVQMTKESGERVTLGNGAHASHAVCTATAVAHLPKDVPVDLASSFVMPGVGLHGTDISNPRLGDKVLVFGAGLVGLSSIAWSNFRGCEVIAVDQDQVRLELALSLGATHTLNPSQVNLDLELKRLAPGGVDVVIEATGDPENIDRAIAATKIEGKFVWQGHYGQGPVSFDFVTAHAKRVRMFFPRGDGGEAARKAWLRVMGSGALKWDRTITHRVEACEAPALYRRINSLKNTDVIGALIHWSG
ncbi:MAG: zinc-binding alcohol dehydrogenase [Deinococcales bacterium]|nr:zinc-binding alcohol dehydrogenase [Deinococcales bacterium]